MRKNNHENNLLFSLLSEENSFNHTQVYVKINIFLLNLSVIVKIELQQIFWTSLIENSFHTKNSSDKSTKWISIVVLVKCLKCQFKLKFLQLKLSRIHLMEHLWPVLLILLKTFIFVVFTRLRKAHKFQLYLNVGNFLNKLFILRWL